MKNSKAGPKMPSQAQALSGEGRPQPRLGHDIQAKIGRQLRAIYDDVVNQGIPDRFAELLDRLDERDDKDTQA